MAETRASASVDLHLDLTGSRVREALERALRDAVRTGRLAPGLQLPSSRALAADLGIARNTVADTYGQLIAEGWLTARQGARTRVADRSPAEEAATATVPIVSRPHYDLNCARRWPATSPAPVASGSHPTASSSVPALPRDSG